MEILYIKPNMVVCSSQDQRGNISYWKKKTRIDTESY